jgi:hypothetical protein
MLGSICSVCDEKIEEHPAYISPNNDECVHGDCMSVHIPQEVFSGFQAAKNIRVLLSMFGDILESMDIEYVSHRNEKGDSWKDMHPERLFGMAVRVFAKVVLADTADEQYSEMIDLALLLLMTATRVNEQVEEPEIPF